MAGEGLLKPIYAASAVLAIAAAVAAGWIGDSGRAALGVIVGCGVALLPFATWQWAAAALAPGMPRSRKVFIAGVMAAKYAVIAAVLYASLKRDWVDPIALGVGMTVVVVAVLGAGVLKLRNPG